MRRFVWLLCALAAGTRVASAQDSPRQLAADRATALQLAQIVDSARAQGLPTDPIIAKARLGALLHTPSDRIVAVARSVAIRLAEARTALAPAPTEAEIAQGADALSIAGVTPDALRALRSARPDKPVAVPIGVLTQLVAAGVPAKRATQIVTDLIKRGANSDQLIALGNNVDFDIGRGARATSALDVRLRGLTAVLPAAAGSATAASLSGSDKPVKQP